MKTSFYTKQELSQLGLKSYGENVRISRYAQIYSPEKISIGDNVRIDDFCILSGNIAIGSHIHIAAYCALYGADYLIGPIHDDKDMNVIGGIVKICAYSQIGAGALIFPDVVVGEGAVLGAMSMAKESLAPWNIYAGIPAKKIKQRSKRLLDLIQLCLE